MSRMKVKKAYQSMQKYALIVLAVALFGIGFVVWKDYERKENDMPDAIRVTSEAALSKTITDTKVVRELYSGLTAFKTLEPNTRMSCPSIPVGYKPTNYTLLFYKGDRVYRHVIFTPPRCRGILKLENGTTMYGITDESVEFRKTLQRALQLTDKEF